MDGVTDEDRGTAEDPRFAGWGVLVESPTPTTLASVVHTLGSPGARRWYFGAGIALLWLISVAAEVLKIVDSPAETAIAIGLLVVFGVVFALGAPIAWALPKRDRPWVAVALWVVSFSLFPFIGWEVTNLWTYVGVLIAMALIDPRATWMSIIGLGVLAAICGWIEGGSTEEILTTPAIIVSISLMMAAFARQLAIANQLRDTQREMTRLAAVQERGRVARDIHDILGHSLTVITVKAELAGRLLDVDVERARTEIGEVETLARGALADVRTTVAGFRGVNVTAELAAARSALASAGIRPEFPSSTDAVPPGRRELAGWVVREGVTNVIRHSGASVCRVRLEPDLIEVADDGGGEVVAVSALASTGLSGLRERVEAAGLKLTTGRSDLGGFELRVSA